MGRLTGRGGSENVQEGFHADKNFWQIEDTCSDINGSQRHFLETCKHSFVQNLKGAINTNFTPRIQSVVCGSPTPAPLGSLFAVSILWSHPAA